MKRLLTIFTILASASMACGTAPAADSVIRTEVLVVGGGTGGTAAGIQSARLGSKTIIVEPTSWLGGMISAAGVSATDGNHRLPSGIWKEFRDRIYAVYGGPAKVETGWVSNTLFEPRVADSIFKAMAAESKDLSIYYGWRFDKAIKEGNKITGAVFINDKNETLTINADITIDATEMGDVMASAAVPYDLGMEAGSLTGERVGITETNNVVQDLTWVAVLKDYGSAADCTIVRPQGYDPNEFDGACKEYYLNKQLPEPTVNAQAMLDYTKIPNGKYLLNWPKAGNDTYLNVVELTEEQRNAELEKAKATTMRFIYFIQHQLGYKNLGLANDEFPTADKLALIPYHREGRRLKGVVRFTMRNLAEPFTYGDPLYRTGISVGDYPIDHHHKKNLLAPQHLEFYPVPSFNVPLGTLIPKEAEGLIVAEKGISVSNVVNGTTRLQPCVMLTGQAAGVLASLSAKQHTAPAQVTVRSVQKALMQSGAWLMPYLDVPADRPQFAAIQRIGATGILKGKGIPYKWANQTWFYPDSTVSETTLVDGLATYYPNVKAATVREGHDVNAETLYKLILMADPSINSFKLKTSLKPFSGAMKRSEIAVVIDEYLKPFDKEVDLNGRLNNTKPKF